MLTPSRSGRTTLLLAVALVCGPTGVSADSTGRYVVGRANGARQQAERITAWKVQPAVVELDQQPWSLSDPPLRWIVDRQSDPPSPGVSWLETWLGDRLPGELLYYNDGTSGPTRQPPHLVLRSVTSARPPQQRERAAVRVRSASVRRIVWRDEGRHYQPGMVQTRDGRRIKFRGLRWNSDCVTLLTQDGRHTFSFSELSELNLPESSPWDALVQALATEAPDPQAWSEPRVQLESASGVIATCAWARQRIVRPQDPAKAANWMHGVQPAWSLDVLWIPGEGIPVRRFFPMDELPLASLAPQRVRQSSPLAGNGRPWQRDRNVEGGWLESGPGLFGGGFGVHASNQLQFPLSPLVTAFQGFVGIDTLAGTGGCVQARVLLEGQPTLTLFETPVFRGSDRVYATGRCSLPAAAASAPRTLVLEVDHAHAQRPAEADPLDVRDSTDWLEPMLQLDRQELQAQVASCAADGIEAWRHWLCQPATGSSLRLLSLWDELSEADPRFATAVQVTGEAPLTLTRKLQLDDAIRTLAITVSCPRQSDPPVTVEVLADGVRLATFAVPVLDRGHLRVAPEVIPLTAVTRAADASVQWEIRQSPGPPEAAVQWQAIEFR